MRGDKVLRLAKGFRGRAKNCVRIARERVEKALQYATRDRRARKRDVRSVWIARIGAGAREHGLTYSSLIAGLKRENVALNRKSLAALAAQEPLSFGALARQVAAMRGNGGGGGGAGGGAAMGAPPPPPPP